MSAQTASVSIPSIFRTLSTAPRTREHHQAARQLVGLDPKKFLSSLQAAAVNRSPHAIAAVKADMVELEDIFHKLSRSGYDVSAAQRDFEMLSHFVSQLASTQKQRSPIPLPPSTSSSQPHHPSKPLPPTPVQKYHHDGGHHRASSLPTSVPSSYEQSRSRTGSLSIVDGSQSSTRYQPHAVHAQVPNNSNSLPHQGRGSAPGSSTSSSSSMRSSSSYSSAQSSSSRVVAPAPRHLIKPRRHSEPVSLSSASSKKVHFATHATVYTFAQEAPALLPPPRPSCIPRVGGSESPRSTSHDGRSRH